jgi:hypothetical protein
VATIHACNWSEDSALDLKPLQGRQVKPLTLALCVAPRRQLSPAARLVIQRLILAMNKLG